jgi:hypothetical protein
MIRMHDNFKNINFCNHLTTLCTALHTHDLNILHQLKKLNQFEETHPHMQFTKHYTYRKIDNIVVVAIIHIQ